MKQTSLLAAVILAASAGVASAGGQAGSLGVGAEFQLSGLGGPSINYDAGQFHLGGFFSFFDPDGPDNTVFEVGGRFYYHLHSTAMSDFSLGGSLGIVNGPDQGMPDNSVTDVFLEPSFQIRLFLASNVALSFTGGISIGLVDASGAAVSGQGISGAPEFDTRFGFTGGAGVHYYFF